MKSAIILAAGIGSRLAPLTDEIPKCCIEVSGKSIIRRITDQLLICDPHMEIIVVAGYKFHIVNNEMKEYPENVILIENKEYLSTNNMESCRIGIGRRKTSAMGCMIINGDCVYSQSIIQKMYESDSSCIATDSSTYNEENNTYFIIEYWESFEKYDAYLEWRLNDDPSGAADEVFKYLVGGRNGLVTNSDNIGYKFY